VTLPPVAYVNLASFLLPPGAGAARWNALGRPMRLLTAYAVYTLVNELTMFVLAQNGVNNLWMLHVYTLAGFIFLVVAFLSFPGMARYRKAVIPVAASYALYWAASKVFLESLSGFDRYSAPPANIIMILVALAALHAASRSVDQDIWRTSFFWFSSAVLVMSVGDFTLLVFAGWFSALRGAGVTAVWSIHWTMSTIVNMLFSVALLCPQRIPAPTGS
jgi:hypothetical protein